MFCDYRYIAAIDGVVNKRHLIAIGEGTVIEGIHCTPDSVELLPRQLDLPRPRLRIVVLVIYSSLLELSDIQYSCCFLCVALCQPGSAAFLLVANFHLLIWNLQVHDGRKHEVRELVKSAGLKVQLWLIDESIFPFPKITLLLVVLIHIGT